MKTIKINVVDWWNQDIHKNYFLNFLSKKYKITLCEDPDYLICSLFGNKHFEYDCVKIFFTGENFTPDFNLYDYALGFDYIDFEDRYMRYPLWLLHAETLTVIQEKHKNISQQDAQRNFCSFVVSNGNNAHRIREEMFDSLSQIDFVASGGSFKNNIGKRVENKNDFIKQYKFNIAFENSKTKGYCTEKLFQAFAAKTIPIYWGWGNEEFVNPKSFVNLDNFSNIQEAVEYIKSLNNDDEKYLQMLKEPVFLHSNIQQYYEDKLESFFDHIFSQPLNQAKRVHRIGTREGYFNSCIDWKNYLQGGGDTYFLQKSNEDSQISYLKNNHQEDLPPLHPYLIASREFNLLKSF